MLINFNIFMLINYNIIQGKLIYLSISPRSISILPNIETRSASKCPFAILFNALTLQKDGGLTLIL